MKSKIILAFLLVAMLCMSMFAFVGCQTPATISLNNNGTITMEVNDTVTLPYDVSGELLQNQKLESKVKIGTEVIEITDNKTVKAKKAGTALIEVELMNGENLGGALSIEVVVLNTKAMNEAKTQIQNVTIDSKVANVESCKALFDATVEYWKSQIDKCITEEQIANTKAEAEKALADLNALLVEREDAKDVIAAYNVDMAKANLIERGMSEEEVDAAIAEGKFVQIENLVKAWTEQLDAATTQEMVELVLIEVPVGFYGVVNNVYVEYLIEQLGIEASLGDEDVITQLENLKKNLTESNEALRAEIDKAIALITSQQSIATTINLQVAQTYNGEAQYFETLPAKLTDYKFEARKLGETDWFVVDSTKALDAGNYELKITTTVTIAENDVEVVSYSGFSIMQGSLSENVEWAMPLESEYVIYTKLNDIPLNKYIEGEGSPNDETDDTHSRIFGYYQWAYGEREIDPVNYGTYAIEFIPVLVNEVGHPVDEEGNELSLTDYKTWVRDNNYRVDEKRVTVGVKDAFVVVTPVEGQWKNYDGKTASNILYTFKVYEDSTRANEITMNDKLMNYVQSNLVGDLVLEDVDGEPAKDAGNWLIKQGTLTKREGARFDMVFEEGVTYEIKPLTITAVKGLEIDKYYDGTTAVKDTSFVVTEYTIVGLDAEGNEIELAIVAGDEIVIYITNANYEDKNAGENKEIICNLADITFEENAGALKNYVLDGEIEIEITGDIFKRPITFMTGRIADREYDGTDIARYLDEVKSERVLKVQNLDAEGNLADSDALIGSILTLASDEVSINLLANGRYFGTEENPGKNVGENKTILFHNSTEVTVWELIGKDAANYVYVGELTDTDVDKHLKVNYVGTITKLVVNPDDPTDPEFAHIRIVDMYAEKVYDGNSDLAVAQLEKNGDTYRATFQFTEDGKYYQTIKNDDLYITAIDEENALYEGFYWDAKNALRQSNVGEWDIMITEVGYGVMTFGGKDAGNYDWTGVEATGTGKITKKTLNISADYYVELNPRDYDGTNIAYSIFKDGNVGIVNFNANTGIISGVVFEGLIGGDSFDVRILKDAEGNYYNGLFADKNVAKGKTATWTNDAENGIAQWELVGENVDNYNFVTDVLYAKGDIEAIRIFTVKFNLIERVYDATNIAYGVADGEKMQLIGTVAEDGSYITIGDTEDYKANVVFEGMIEGDELFIQISSRGSYNDKNAALEKEALFTGWNIVGADAGNYFFSADTMPGDLAPVTTVKGVGVVSPKQITKISVTGYEVDKLWNGSIYADFEALNKAIAEDTATVEFEGIIAGDDLSILITATGKYGILNADGTFTAKSDKNEAGSPYDVLFTQKNATGADRNNYFVDGTDVYAKGNIL